MLLPHVIAAVVAELGVLADVLTVAGRHGNVARDAAIWLSRELSPCSLEEVSAAFGEVIRSAVTDAVRRCERRMSASASYRPVVSLGARSA